MLRTTNGAAATVMWPLAVGLPVGVLTPALIERVRNVRADVDVVDGVASICYLRRSLAEDSRFAHVDSSSVGADENAIERTGGMTTIENGSATRELAEKRALVTGGSRGIAAAIVRRFLDVCAEVLTTKVGDEHGAGGATFVAADVRTRAGAEALASAA